MQILLILKKKSTVCARAESGKNRFGFNTVTQNKQNPPLTFITEAINTVLERASLHFNIDGDAQDYIMEIALNTK